MADRDRINKIRNLAEHGATEGERAAAREALKRMEAAEPGSTQARPDLDAAAFTHSFLNDTDFLRGKTFDSRMFEDLLFTPRQQRERVTHDFAEEARARFQREREQQAEMEWQEIERRILHIMRTLRLTPDDLREFITRMDQAERPEPPRQDARSYGGRVHWDRSG